MCDVQIEAALSRMPGAGGRVSLQTRLDEVRLHGSHPNIYYYVSRIYLWWLLILLIHFRFSHQLLNVVQYFVFLFKKNKDPENIAISLNCVVCRAF